MLQPNILCDKIYDIDPALLEQMGIKALALDVDNTLTLHDSQEVPDRVRAFLEKMKEKGMALFIISNKSCERVKPFAEGLGLEFVHSAAKPLTFGLARACRRFSLSKKEIMLVGDQLFTDILAAKLFGCRCALVTPFQIEHQKFLRFKRVLERPILRGIHGRKERETRG